MSSGGGGNKTMGFLAGGPVGALVADQLDLTGEKAADSALDAQSKATNRANDEIESTFRSQMDQAKPYRDAGTGAVKSLADNSFMKDWQQDPGYQFRMDQGNKAINAAAAARGMGNSGATMKALANYGQDYGSSEYGKVYDRNYNRLSSLANLGGNMTGRTMDATSHYGDVRSGNYINQGNAEAGASMAKHNGMMNLINQGTSMASMAMGMPSGGGMAVNQGQNTIQGGTRMGSTMTPFK